VVFESFVIVVPYSPSHLLLFLIPHHHLQELFLSFAWLVLLSPAFVVQRARPREQGVFPVRVQHEYLFPEHTRVPAKLPAPRNCSVLLHRPYCNRKGYRFHFSGCRVNQYCWIDVGAELPPHLQPAFDQFYLC